MDRDEVADELYALPPEEFVPARKARADQAKAEGDKALAQEIGSLPKPSTAAWVCNLLVRYEGEEIAGLVELGGLLREAQESLAGDQVRALDVQRRQLIAALTRQARALAYEQGHAVTTQVATQVEETLRAAMADPDAGEALLSGRLTAPMSYSGMGTGARPNLRLVPPPRATPKRGPAEPSPRKGGRRTADGGNAAEERRRREEEARRAAEELRRRELAEARQEAQTAEAAVEEAAEVEQEAGAQADELSTREDDLRARIDDLTQELARLREECTTVGTELSRALRRKQSAEHRRRDAEVALAHARRRVEQLGRTPED